MDRKPELKAVFFVGELAERWGVHPETVRIMIRQRKIRPLRGFKPFRITYDEVKRYESHDEVAAAQAAILRS